MRHVVSLVIVLMMGSTSAHPGSCVGRFVNPITDICWKCLFPISIAGFKVVSGNPEPKSPHQLTCTCKDRYPYRMIGFPVSFWEPARLVDITRTPYCMIGLGGVAMGGSGVKGRGDVALDLSNDTMHSFYQVHWYIYPVIYWFELLTDFMCLEKSEFDVGYLTELDPFWNDDELSALLNPEAILFGNPIAQAACAADCIAATTHLPFAPLIWCAGCLGSVYPFTGTVTSHNGGVQVSSLLAIRMMAKLHRELVLHGYIGVKGLCGKYPMPVIQKQQYRLQMTYPIPSTGNARKSCHALGHTDVTWNMGREFPYKGEDFGYLVWRKRDCCL